MTEFADLSEVLNRISGGNSGNPETLFYSKDLIRHSSGSTLNRLSMKSYSLWMADGGFPGCGVAPTTAAVPTAATRGALPFTNGTGGGREKRIVSAVFSGAYPLDYAAEVTLYDRLFHIGNLSGTSVAAQNVQSGSGVSLTRHTGGVGNEIWIEVYGTALGGTVRTATCSYTNQAGTSGRTTQATPIGGSGTGAGVVSIIEMGKMQLQAGDTGVQSVETLTLSASTGTAGVWGITIANHIASIPMHDSIGIYDFTYGNSGTYVLEDNACLATIYRGSSSSSPMLAGMIATAER